MISGVDDGSLAEEAGLTRGTIITRIIAGTQRMEIKDVEDFKRAERLFKSGTDVAFMVMRPNPNTNEYASSFVAITIP